MYRFKTEIGNFEIPSSYHELKVKDLVYCQGKTELEMLERLTGFDAVKLLMLDLSDFGKFLSFMNEPLSNIEPIDFVGNFDLSFDFREASYGKKVKASQHLQDFEPLEALAIYCDCDVSVFDELSVFEVFGSVNYMVSKLKEMDEERYKMLHVSPTKEQVLAGISDFDKLGEFNTIDMIARNYNYTHKEVEELEYNLVILILYRSKIQSNFENKLRDIVTK